VILSVKTLKGYIHIFSVQEVKMQA